MANGFNGCKKWYLYHMKYLLPLFAFVLFSCSRPQPADLVHLNGYWEIESAKMKDGTTREYTINPTVEYFELKDRKGVRKKLMAQIDGKFIDAGNPAESFEVIDQDGKMMLKYTMPGTSWQEELIEIDANHMVMRTQHEMTFIYKRHQPIKL